MTSLTFYERVDQEGGGYQFRAPNGELVYARDLPPGAVYLRDSCWSDTHEPRCAEHVTVVCPNGRHWDIDSRASNCTMPNDKAHRCWVRHGDPRNPSTLHVDKNGPTCAAGAGSIMMGDYHGFLHNGMLTDNM